MMTDSLGSAGELPPEKQRQLFFLGTGLYGGILGINLVFYLAYVASSPHIQII
jgi:hypothetical protein